MDLPIQSLHIIGIYRQMKYFPARPVLGLATTEEESDDGDEKDNYFHFHFLQLPYDAEDPSATGHEVLWNHLSPSGRLPFFF
jgi:hypothetical protein